jgi:hypothetical protein
MSSAFDGTLLDWLDIGCTEEEFDEMLTAEGRCWWCYLPLDEDSHKYALLSEPDYIVSMHATCAGDMYTPIEETIGVEGFIHTHRPALEKLSEK